MRYLLFLLIVGSSMMVGCNKSNFEERADSTGGRLYAPIEESKYRIFHYDTVFCRGANVDTFSGYLKHEIGESFELQNGETSNKLFVYWKRNKKDAFQLHRVETIRLDGDRLVVSEDGLNFIKLAFPLAEGKGWFGNKLFDTSDGILENIYGDVIETIKKGADWRYLPQTIDNALELDSVTVDRGLIVRAVDAIDNIEERFVEEYYGEGIGMVGKQMRIFDTQDGKTGYSLNLQLIDHN